MKKIIAACMLLSFSTVACQAKVSELSSKKKSEKEFDYKNSSAARSVQALEKESGVLHCSGVDSKMNFVRTRAKINSGKLESLTVEAFANKANPADVPNDLMVNLQQYQLFSHDVSKKILDLELDLQGSKFDIEVRSEMNGKARKIYDLEIRAENDGEGASTLNAFLSYKDPSVEIDTSEIMMGCFVKLDK